jgi:hypothetical protein
MAMIFVDVEARGPCPSLGELTEFGAVEFETEETFHGIVAPCRSSSASITEEQKRQVFIDFEAWLRKFPGRPIFWSDNPAWDFQWINDSFFRYLGTNPFGHSGRRISDFYAGLVNDLRRSTKWKKLRITRHDHQPVHDALGNVEAFKRILKGERP